MPVQLDLDAGKLLGSLDSIWLTLFVKAHDFVALELADLRLLQSKIEAWTIVWIVELKRIIKSWREHVNLREVKHVLLC